MVFARGNMVGTITITEDGQKVTRYVTSTYPPAIQLSGDTVSLPHNSQVQIAKTYSESYTSNMFMQYKLQVSIFAVSDSLSDCFCTLIIRKS